MYQLAVSGLAWTDDEEAQGLALLSELNVRGVELLPFRIESSADTHRARVQKYHHLMEKNSLTPVAMQALYFGSRNLHLLEDEAQFGALVERTEEIAVLADDLGVRIGVFGAPSVRSNPALDKEVALELGLERLLRLDRMLANHDFRLLIEPVPAYYGNSFLTTSDQIVAALNKMPFSNIGLQLDIGCVTLGGGDIVDDIKSNAGHFDHFHISEPDLGPYDSPMSHHEAAGTALRAIGYERWVAIEMKRQSPDWRAAIEKAVEFAVGNYL